jgi:hypothetical protein
MKITMPNLLTAGLYSILLGFCFYSIAAPSDPFFWLYLRDFSQFFTEASSNNMLDCFCGVYPTDWLYREGPIFSKLTNHFSVLTEYLSLVTVLFSGDGTGAEYCRSASSSILFAINARSAIILKYLVSVCTIDLVADVEAVGHVY